MEKSKRILTTIVRLRGSIYKVLPVKSTKAVDINMHVECSKALCRLNISIPVNAGDIICRNILNTGADIVSTKTVLK